jgi:hypothetical protein
VAEVAFPALLHSLKVQMVYGDKEATLTLKFRPEGTSVENLNNLMVGDRAVMVGIVPIVTENKREIQARKQSKSKGTPERGEV